jgi:metal-responsive CopG/Arc/MetJ family transcriptional regulator
MKTAISLPEELFAEADALARRLGSSRSALFAAALREYLARHEPDAVTATLDRVYSEERATFEPVLAAAAVRTLAASEW